MFTARRRLAPPPQILLCLTLFCFANLLTRVISSLAGVSIKRWNHRRRMLDIAKRVGCCMKLC
jgi:hypothetical protein